MTKKEISEILGIDQNTLKNWETGRPELHKIVMQHFEEEKCPDMEDETYLKQEIIKKLDKLPKSQVKIIYHTIMLELAKQGH